MIYFIGAGLTLAILLKGNPIYMLDKIRLKFLWLFIVIFVIQVIIYIWFQTAAREYPLYFELLLLTIIFGLWMNRHLKGVPWILVGASINLLAIILHGGVMPVSIKALELAQLHIADDARHQAFQEGFLWWIGDWIPLYKKVISTGDLFIGTGVIIFMLKHTPKRGTYERKE